MRVFLDNWVDTVTNKIYQVFLNGRFLNQPVTGVQRYALELIKGIDRLLEVSADLRNRFSITLLVPSNLQQVPALSYIKVKQVGRFTGQLWEQLELPFYSRNGLLVGFCNTGPLLKQNQIVTFCDASVYRIPEAYSLLFRLWYRTLYSIISRRTKRLLTISCFSRDELATCCGIKPEKFTVVSPGVDHCNWGNDTETIPAGALCSIDKPFILAVSSMSLHKNFRALVKAVTFLDDTDFDVIIAGGSNPAIFKTLDVSCHKTVKYVGYVNDDELKSFYSRATCFVYPSLYEGFGLPPLEAMSNGCPVIVARAGALPEVCGDAALYFDPLNPLDIADKIKLVMSDVNLRENLKKKGLERAKKFTWDKSAQETLSVIEKVLSN